MSANISCACGKQFAWKPELAGKRGRCKCGQAVSFPVEPPTDESYELADLTELERTGRPLPQPAVVPVATRRPTQKPATAPEPATLRHKLTLLGMGLALMAYFVAWPMMQVLQHAPSVAISFKGIALSISCMFGGVGFFLFDEKKVAALKDPLIRKITLVVVVGSWLLVCAGIWYFFKANGYKITF